MLGSWVVCDDNGVLCSGFQDFSDSVIVGDGGCARPLVLVPISLLGSWFGAGTEAMCGAVALSPGIDIEDVDVDEPELGPYDPVASSLRFTFNMDLSSKVRENVLLV